MAMLEMIFTLCSCWHHHIESVMASPLSTFESIHIKYICNDDCPHCNGTLYKFLTPIVKSGTIESLACIFVLQIYKIAKTIRTCKRAIHLIFLNTGILKAPRDPQKSSLFKYPMAPWGYDV